MWGVSPLYPPALTPFHLPLSPAGQQQEDSSIRAQTYWRFVPDIREVSLQLVKLMKTFSVVTRLYIYSMYKSFWAELNYYRKTKKWQKGPPMDPLCQAFIKHWKSAFSTLGASIEMVLRTSVGLRTQLKWGGGGVVNSFREAIIGARWAAQATFRELSSHQSFNIWRWNLINDCPAVTPLLQVFALNPPPSGLISGGWEENWTISSH